MRVLGPARPTGPDPSSWVVILQEITPCSHAKCSLARGGRDKYHIKILKIKVRIAV